MAPQLKRTGKREPRLTKKREERKPLRKRTRTPEAVNIGRRNWRAMGGRLHSFFPGAAGVKVIWEEKIAFEKIKMNSRRIINCFKVSTYLSSTRNFLDTPQKCIILRAISRFSACGRDGRVCGIQRSWDFNQDIISHQCVRKFCADPNMDVDACRTDFVNLREDFEWEMDILRDPVLHQLKLPVRRTEADRAICAEFTKTHALMKGAMVHFNPLRKGGGGQGESNVNSSSKSLSQTV